MQVLIIGGGIAGPVLGSALRQAGIDATVYEANGAAHGGAGAFLQLAPNGMNALKAVGLGDVPRWAGGFPTSGIRFFNPRGRVIGELDSSEEQQRYDATNVLVRRDKLHAALQQAAIGLDVPVRHDKRLAEHRVTTTGVEALFADGTTAHGDVLIGCDGIGSRTRRRRLHADDPTPVPEILAASDPPVGPWAVHELPPLPRWHDERVCLVGDAAHAMSPSAGQGAAIAIEDAVVLAKCLRDESDAQHAFATYEHLRKDRAEAVVRQARRNSNTKIPGPLGGLIRDLLLPVFLRMGVRKASETYGYQLAWDGPDAAQAA